MATLDAALSQMLAAGLPQPESITYGKLIRYGKPKKKYWYVLHEYRSRNGTYFVNGAYGYFEGPEKFVWTIQTDYTGMDADERERVQRSIKAQQEAEQQKKLKRAELARNRGKDQWARASETPPAEPHGYLLKKGVTPEGCRFLDGLLVIPMWSLAGEKPEMKGVQKIDAQGGKLFNKGMDVVGAMCPLGRIEESTRVAFIAEGWASARSARMATQETVPVFVAFTSGQLMAVAKQLRKRYPGVHFIFLADDDCYLNAQLNKHLAKYYEVAFSIEQPMYQVGEGARRYQCKSGELTIAADWFADPENVDTVVGAITYEGKMRPFTLKNAGLTSAHDAAWEIKNATVLPPEFADRKIGFEPDTPKLTDFNDLHATEGLEAVKAQLEAAILLAIAPPGAKAKRKSEGGEQPSDQKSRAATPAAGKRGGDKRKGGGGGRGGDDPPDYRLFRDFWRDRFTLVYGTDFVFDHDLAMLVKISHLGHAYTTPIVKWWLGWEGRATVNKDDVVFDPIGAADPDKTVNLFRGMESTPNPKAKCDRLLDLLYYLCGENREDTHTPVTDWVLRWMAFPLQNIGAKMRTSVAMYGAEGTGKNIFWGAIRDIYGRYGGIIGQNQLTSQFNTWLSAKLFLIANEVVTASDRTYYVGYLKNLITETEVLVEPKGIDARRESNHVNLVFLSNELHMLKIMPGDRRFMVIQTPEPRDKAYYDAIGAELRAGGAEALYHYLLHLDLGGFNEHTKPLFTDAKADLIELSMSSPQLYWRDLHDGMLPMPYGTCFMQDCYDGYLIWAARTGEKMPMKRAQFSRQFCSMNGVRRTPPLRIADPDSVKEQSLPKSDLPQRIVYEMGAAMPMDGSVANIDKWREEQVIIWRAALNQYRSRGRYSGRHGEDQDEPF